MTAPASPPPLTAEQLRHLQVLVGPDAWAYHETLGEQVDPAAALEVHGTLKLVAADILDLAGTGASGVDEQPGQLKRLRIEGKYEEEYFQAGSAQAVRAGTWCTKAARYRKEAASPAGVRVVPTPLAGMRAGGPGEPVFRLTAPAQEPR